MSRRGRAIGFGAAAAVCAGLAASVTGGSQADLAVRYGDLREVVVAAESLPARRRLDHKTIAGTLELRRVPDRFIPPDALSDPAQALGRAPSAPIPAGGYLLGSQLRTPRRGTQGELDPAGAGQPVEISVEGAGALASRPGGPGRRVDVVVTSEPGPGGGAGRTYVAAERVGLLDLRTAGEFAAQDLAPGPATEAWIATLALTRAQALRLIHAESFARSVRLIPS